MCISLLLGKHLPSLFFLNLKEDFSFKSTEYNTNNVSRDEKSLPGPGLAWPWARMRSSPSFFPSSEASKVLEVGEKALHESQSAQPSAKQNYSSSFLFSRFFSSSYRKGTFMSIGLACWLAAVMS